MHLRGSAVLHVQPGLVGANVRILRSRRRPELLAGDNLGRADPTSPAERMGFLLARPGMPKRLRVGLHGDGGRCERLGRPVPASGRRDSRGLLPQVGPYSIHTLRTATRPPLSATFDTRAQIN